MEEKNKINKLIARTLISIVLCLLLIGIAVYAAVTQNVTFVNKISIVGSSDVRTSVVVSEYIGPSTLEEGEEEQELYTGENTFGQFTEFLNKPKEINSLSTSDTGVTQPTQIEFKKDNVYTYVAYKFSLKNEGNKIISYTINSKQVNEVDDYIFNSQLDIYTGTNSSGTIVMTKSADNKVSMTGDLSYEVAENEVDLYIVIAVNVSLLDIDTVAQESFAITCQLKNKGE